MPSIKEEQKKAARLLREADQMLRQATHSNHESALPCKQHPEGTDFNYDDLWKAYANNGHDDTARNDIIEAYFPIVQKVASHVSTRIGYHFHSSDLENSGVLGLIDAIKNYDSSKGYRFVTYATPRIRGAIIDYLRLHQTAQPRQDSINRVINMSEEIEKQAGHAPSDEEVASRLRHYNGERVTPKYVHKMRNIHPVQNIDFSGELSHSQESEYPLFVLPSNSHNPTPDEIAEQNDTRRRVMEILDYLPRRAKTVITLYYFEGLDMKTTGRILGLTESRVCQIHSEILEKLRHRME